MLEKISEKTKRIIAESHIEGYGQDLETLKRIINTKTFNYKTNLGRDLTNTNLFNKFNENTALFDVKKRGFWELFLMLDKESNILFTFMSEDSLNRLLKDKTREIPHYVDILSQNNDGLLAKTKQMTFPGVRTNRFEKDELKLKLLELCHNLILGTKDVSFRHAIITNTKQGGAVASLHIYIFDAELNLVEDESWNKYLKPSYDDLEFNLPNNNEEEIIKPKLKQQYAKHGAGQVSPKVVKLETKNNETDSGN